MKILHIANFSWVSSSRKRPDNLARYYAIDHKISNGLIRNGHCVWSFSYRDTARALSPFAISKKLGAGRMQKHLIETAQQFSPDVILLGHAEIIDAKTIVQLRSALPNIKIAQWWVDWFTDNALVQLREKQPHLDAFFATTSPAHYAPLLDSNKNSPPLYYMPNIIDRSVETGQAFAATNYDYDVFFAGAETSERRRILSAVSKMPNVKCGIFGMDKKSMLGGAQLMNAIAASKIGLNLSQTTKVPLYSSARIAQTIGNGALAIIPRAPELTNLFSEDEAAYVDSEEELPDMILRYLKDDTARRKVAESGWRRAQKSYNEQRVTKFMIEAIMGESFSEQYEWLYASVLPTAKKTHYN